MKLPSLLAALMASVGSASAKVVEIDLTAKKAEIAFGNGGVMQTMYTYNGSVPGPSIEANVGDTLKVRFTNELDMPTTVHWHGVELPAAMDGSSISQSPVAPGESFTYEFPCIRAATHWYHPHVMSDLQTDMGMYGSLIIRDPDGLESDLPEVDHVVLLDDALLQDGILAPHHTDSMYADTPEVKAERLLNGKIGNTRLVNGNIVPHKGIELERGVPFTVRFINVANTLFFRLNFPGHTVHLIGSDGGLVQTPREILPIETLTDENGEYSDPDPTKGLLLTPGERAVVWVDPNFADQDFVVEWHDLPVGRHEVTVNDDGSISANHAHPDDGRRPKETLISWNVEVNSDSGLTQPIEQFPPTGVAMIEKLAPSSEAEVLKFDMGHGAASLEGQVFMFGQIFNGTKLSFDDITPEMAYSVNAGDVRYIDVANTDGHDHNWHLHGFHFQIVDTKWIMKDATVSKTEEYPYLEWKDTVWITRRPEAGGKTVVRLAVKFGGDGRKEDFCAEGGVPSEGKSGGWLAHCHMLEHGEAGMMSYVQVTGCDAMKLDGPAPGDSATPDQTGDSDPSTDAATVGYVSWVGYTMGLFLSFTILLDMA